MDLWYLPTLIQKQAPLLSSGHSIVLAGYDYFQKPMNDAHAALEKVGIVHQYLNGPARAHHWYSGWVPEALAALMRVAGNERDHTP